MFETRHFATRDGLVLAADIGGPADAPTIILLHGGGQTRHSWAREMAHLVRDGYRVVNYDARGHGDSGWSADGDYRIEALAADLLDMLADVGRPLALVGASMGGITALYATGTAPAPIAEALLLVDIVPRPARAGAERILQFMTANPDGFATLEDAADAVAAYNPERPRPKSSEGLRRNLRLRDGRLYWHWDPRLIAREPNAEPPQLSPLTLEAATHVTIPTLLVRGGRSDVIDDDGIAELKQLIPQTEVVEVANAGHMVAGDDNSAFHDGIIAFLGRHLPLAG